MKIVIQSVLIWKVSIGITTSLISNFASYLVSLKMLKSLLRLALDWLSTGVSCLISKAAAPNSYMIHQWIPFSFSDAHVRFFYQELFYFNQETRLLTNLRAKTIDIVHHLNSHRFFSHCRHWLLAASGLDHTPPQFAVLCSSSDFIRCWLDGKIQQLGNVVMAWYQGTSSIYSRRLWDGE